MSGRPLRIALLGCGVVGVQVARLLTEQADDLAARVGVPLELAGIAVRRLNRKRDIDLDPALFTTDAAALVARDDIDIVVEVIGGIEPARSRSRKSRTSRTPLTRRENGAPIPQGWSVARKRQMRHTLLTGRS